jgi:uncharacterized protein YraI
LYYGGAWHDIFVLTWDNYTSFRDRLDSVYGCWGGVTAIRAIGTCHGRKATGYTWAYGEWVCQELRAIGTPISNIQRYGIGAAGVPEVDYVISVKRWDF